MEKNIYTISVKREGNQLWCTCNNEPGVYGFYMNEGEASVDLRYQIKHEIMFKEGRFPEEEIILEFEYD